MVILKLLSYLFLFLIAFSCKVNEKTSTREKNIIREIKLSKEFSSPEKNSHFKIKDAFIFGDILAIVVDYSGGCETHEWELKGTTNFKKSLPPKKGLYLEHDSNGDNCRSSLKDTLQFNLNKIKYPGKESNYTVVIQLNNYEKNITYKY
tara:strand:- start:581 stop:1027 length:447 start_codon:yes stop_codon:yes gene_type:complete